MHKCVFRVLPSNRIMFEMERERKGGGGGEGGGREGGVGEGFMGVIMESQWLGH